MKCSVILAVVFLAASNSSNVASAKRTDEQAIAMALNLDAAVVTDITAAVSINSELAQKDILTGGAVNPFELLAKSGLRYRPEPFATPWGRKCPLGFVPRTGFPYKGIEYVDQKTAFEVCGNNPNCCAVSECDAEKLPKNTANSASAAAGKKYRLGDCDTWYPGYGNPTSNSEGIDKWDPTSTWKSCRKALHPLIADWLETYMSCTDTDVINGSKVTNRVGVGCGYYYRTDAHELCGRDWDTKGFTARRMCCACGGGLKADPDATAVTTDGQGEATPDAIKVTTEPRSPVLLEKATAVTTNEA